MRLFQVIIASLASNDVRLTAVSALIVMSERGAFIADVLLAAIGAGMGCKALLRAGRSGDYGNVAVRSISYDCLVAALAIQLVFFFGDNIGANVQCVCVLGGVVDVIITIMIGAQSVHL